MRPIQLLMELKTKSTELPASVGKGKNDSEVGRAMVQYLKRNSKFWNKLKEEYADEGAVIGSYSLRHAFAYRGVFLYEMNPDKYKRKSMGIVLKRRDNAPIVKVIYGGIIDIIMKDKSIYPAITFLKISSVPPAILKPGAPSHAP